MEHLNVGDGRQSDSTFLIAGFVIGRKVIIQGCLHYALDPGKLVHFITPVPFWDNEH